MFLNPRSNRQEPIQSGPEDKLNRSTFVGYVTNIIRNAPTENRAFIVAINGKWGEGKTSVKNLIMEKLLYNKKANYHMLLEFNSIEFQNQKELNKIFLDKVVNVIKGGGKEPRFMDFLRENKRAILSLLCIAVLAVGIAYPNVFVRFSSLLFSVMLIFRSQFRKITLGTLMEVLSKSYVKVDVVHRILYYDDLKVYNIENAKLKKYLETKCIYNKIVVFVDNFDSLEPNQIKMLIQLINSKLNLPKFVFVLFYDKFIVENSLNTNVYSGSEFIEKFVNVQLDLPMITEDVLFTSLQVELQEKYGINIEFIRKFSCVKNYFSSLNKIYSFLDNFSVNYTIASKNLKHNKFDFNKNDFLFLEILRFFENDLYRVLRQSKRLLTKHNLKVENKDIWPEIIKSTKNNTEENIRELMLELFPFIGCGTDKDYEYDEEELQSSRSVGCFDYFDYYFIYDLSENVIPENTFDRLKDYLLNGEEFIPNFKKEFSIVNDSSIHYYAGSFLYKIYKRAENISILEYKTDVTLEKELLKNLLWLYIYSDKNASSRKYLTQVLLTYHSKHQNLQNTIDNLVDILEERNYFNYFYVLELLSIIKNVVLDVVFAKKQDKILIYRTQLNRIIFEYTELFLSDENVLKYLSKNDFNSRIQLNHIITFIKYKILTRNQTKTDNEVEIFIKNYMKSGKFEELKDKIFKNYFKLLYIFTESCIKKRIINNSLYLILDPNDLYPLTVKDVEKAFRANKISRKDKVYNVLLKMVKRV